MSKPVSTIKKICKQCSPEFRLEALKLAERIGVAVAARELSLYESQLYNWRRFTDGKEMTIDNVASIVFWRENF